jgi:alkane 1-monooxygenase
VVLEWAVFLGVVIRINTFTMYNLVPMLFMRANLYSSGFLIAHELFHKESIFDKTIGTVHMIKSFYMHFMVEHIYGHHKNVSTPLDPASAPKGMTVY